MAATSDGPIFAYNMSRTSETTLRHMGEDLAQPPITRVCRRIREESLPVWYSQNKFIFRDCGNYYRMDHVMNALLRWARIMRDAGYAPLIKDCVLEFHGTAGQVWDLEEVLDEICPCETPEVTLIKVWERGLTHGLEIDLYGKNRNIEPWPNDSKWLVID